MASKILLISEDEELNRYFRDQLVTKGGYVVSFCTSGQLALEALEKSSFDVIITEPASADSDSVELIHGLKRVDPDCVIIVLLEEADPQILKDLFGLGIHDFITRPIDLEKLFYLVNRGTELHASMTANRRLIQILKEQNLTLEKQNALLTKRVGESTKNLTRLYEDLRVTYMRTIKVLAQAIDARDHYTHSHSESVARFAVAIANEMNLPVKDTEMIREACELHDLGKIGVEDNILGKALALTDKEWEQVKRHPEMGAKILEPLTFLGDVIELIRQHHEHYDGTGYPEGRKGSDILLGARIIHLADAYDSMRSSRAYRKEPLTKEQAIAELKKNSGTQFDPAVVTTFLRIADTIDKG